MMTIARGLRGSKLLGRTHIEQVFGKAKNRAVRFRKVGN